ncbi:MAG: tetratricopeptide repeat protein [Saprospiraceae bacterium]
MAAQLMEESNKLYDGLYSWNCIGLNYSNANDNQKAINCYKKELELNPESSTTMFNLSHQYKTTNPEKLELLKKALLIDPEHEPALIEMAKLLKISNPSKAKEMENEAYRLLRARYEDETLPEWGKSWLINISSKLGHKDFARKVRSEKESLNDIFDNRVIVSGDIINYK